MFDQLSSPARSTKATETNETPAPSAPAVDDRWGAPIAAERAAELQRMLDAWDAPDAQQGERKGPFDGAALTGADVGWLAERIGRNEIGSQNSVHLEGADLRKATLEGARLSFVHLEGADLRNANLDGANLSFGRLDGADLSGARLVNTILFEAHLERATLRGARLACADLRGVTLDRGTDLASAFLTEDEGKNAWVNFILRVPRYGPALGDIHWGNFDQVQLTQMRGWESLRRLADEYDLGWRKDALIHGNAIRAYRQISQRLRNQGYSDVADNLMDRAQVLQRKRYFRQMLEESKRPWRIPVDAGRWLFSWFLALLAGYGYHPGRSVCWYLATILGFALLFSHFGVTQGHRLNPVESLVYSVTSFHGRGFFPSGIGLDDPVAILAACEAVIGLLIEICFIATFTQRFFSNT